MPSHFFARHKQVVFCFRICFMKFKFRIQIEFEFGMRNFEWIRLLDIVDIVLSVKTN